MKILMIAGNIFFFTIMVIFIPTWTKKKRKPLIVWTIPECKKSIRYLFDIEHLNVAQMRQLLIMCICLLPIVDYDFLSDCPSLMLGIAICYMQQCQAMLECGVCELAHYFFHSKCSQALKTCLKLGFWRLS